MVGVNLDRLAEKLDIEDELELFRSGREIADKLKEHYLKAFKKQ